MVGFRNIAVHNYQAVNIDILRDVIEKHTDDFFEFILVLSPFYSVGAIVLFIMMIKKFNSEIKK